MTASRLQRLSQPQRLVGLLLQQTQFDQSIQGFCSTILQSPTIFALHQRAANVLRVLPRNRKTCELIFRQTSATYLPLPGELIHGDGGVSLQAGAIGRLLGSFGFATGFQVPDYNGVDDLPVIAGHFDLGQVKEITDTVAAIFLLDDCPFPVGAGGADPDGGVYVAAQCGRTPFVAAIMAAVVHQQDGRSRLPLQPIQLEQNLRHVVVAVL